MNDRHKEICHFMFLLGQVCGCLSNEDFMNKFIFSESEKAFIDRMREDVFKLSTIIHNANSKMKQ